LAPDDPRSPRAPPERLIEEALGKFRTKQTTKGANKIFGFYELTVISFMGINILLG